MEVVDGPAFPNNYVQVDNGHQVISHGMTLRDYFAAQLVTAQGDVPRAEADIQVLVVRAYRIADAMLVERGYWREGRRA